MKKAGFIKKFNQENFSKEFKSFFKENELDEKDRNILIKFMENGLMCVPFMGCVEDPLDEDDENFIAYMAVYTDGIYYWPQYALEFVKKYPKFQLDNDFLLHAKRNYIKKPTITEKILEKLEEKFYSFGEWEKGE